jgi:hypothetical protein
MIQYMEKVLKIKTKDGKIIRAVLRGFLSKSVIMQVYGLVGDVNTALQGNVARCFEKDGFSSLRFNLYV